MSHIEKILCEAEAVAVKQRKELGIKGNQVVDLQVVVVNGQVAFIGDLSVGLEQALVGSAASVPRDTLTVVDYIDPVTKLHDERVSLALTGYMLLACCQYARVQDETRSDDYLVVWQAITKLQLALQFPEIRSEVIQEYLPDIKLGRHRRKSLAKFGEIRGAELRAEREREWAKWRNEADRLKRSNPALAGKGKKSELARIVIRNLGLSEKEQAVRKRL